MPLQTLMSIQRLYKVTDREDAIPLEASFMAEGVAESQPAALPVLIRFKIDSTSTGLVCLNSKVEQFPYTLRMASTLL